MFAVQRNARTIALSAARLSWAQHSMVFRGIASVKRSPGRPKKKVDDPAESPKNTASAKKGDVRVGRPKRTASVKKAEDGAGRPRKAASARKDDDPGVGIYIPHTPLAEELAATGVWTKKKRASVRTQKKISGDRLRVNIVDEKACDDIVSYFGPTLERHQGCDIIDLYPGPGLWSRKLNDFLKPRSHILMEPEEDLYKPFLEPLLSRPGTTFIPKPGIVWDNLTKVLSPTYLPHQVELGTDEEPRRNDTLLLVANLASHPRKMYLTYPLAALVMFQLLSSIRMNTLIHKYGLVRMLVWVSEAEQRLIVPQAVQRRRRFSVEADLYTEWVRVVCAADPALAPIERLSARDNAISMASARATLDRMRAADMEMPEDRTTGQMRRVLEAEANGEPTPVPGAQAPDIEYPHRAELAQLEELHQQGKLAPGSEGEDRYRKLKARIQWETRRLARVQTLLEERDALIQQYVLLEKQKKAQKAQDMEQLEQHQQQHEQGEEEDGSKKEATMGEREKKAEEEEAPSNDELIDEAKLEERRKAWEASLARIEVTLMRTYQLVRDSLRTWQQDPPLLQWDRRAYEPLAVRPEEFFPTVTPVLLDVQPRVVDPVQRPSAPGHTGDVLAALLSMLLRDPMVPIHRVISKVWHGADDGVIPNCPSLRDPTRGGSPLGGPDAPVPRTLTEAQWLEIVHAWIKWPFRPRVSELIAGSQIAEEQGTAEGGAPIHV